MKKFLKSNTFYAIVSLIISILLWAYVVYEVRPTYEMWVRDVPVVCTNVSRLFEEGSLEIDGDYESLTNGTMTVDIKVKGNRGNVSSVGPEDLSCTVDMITVDEAGSFSLKPTVETDVPSVSITQVSPATFKFSVDSITQSDVDVELVKKGELPEGYVIEDLEARTEKIKITGPMDVIKSVSRAYIELDCSALSVTDFEKSLQVVFEDKNGAKIDSSRFSKSMEYIKVSFNIYTEREVDIILTPKYKDENRENKIGQNVMLYCVSESGKESSGVEMKVTLKGTADAIEKYVKSVKTVYTEEIDVEDIYMEKTFYSVKAAELANNVEYVEVPSVNVKAVVK
ncbi:MAG: hypothetical protein E7394_07615 [Ruminococcaceae bacterium]|nr:hypothetical protein [Oscillospiraceae bacterium]